jgi:hypothetical protein
MSADFPISALTAMSYEARVRHQVEAEVQSTSQSQPEPDSSPINTLKKPQSAFNKHQVRNDAVSLKMQPDNHAVEATSDMRLRGGVLTDTGDVFCPYNNINYDRQRANDIRTHDFAYPLGHPLANGPRTKEAMVEEKKWGKERLGQEEAIGDSDW